MPTYLYECKECGRFERFQKITAEALTECPQCQGPVRRVIGAPGIIFKGSGFYSTDSRESKSTLSGSSPAAGNSDGKEKASGGKEEKTAGKKEAAASSDEKAC